MKIAVVEACNEEMADIAWAVSPNHERYCQRWGYDYISVGTWEDSTRHPAWARWRVAMNALSRYDAVFMIDTDLLFMNYLKSLEPILAEVPDMAFTHDVNGLNAGAVFMRNTPWANAFLQKLWDTGPRFAGHTSPDQTALAYLLYMEPKDKWACLPQRTCNSYIYRFYPWLDYPEGDYHTGDLILHLPSMNNGERLDILSRQMNKWCLDPQVVEGRTALCQGRCVALMETVLETADVPGRMAEVGVYNGGSAMLIARCAPNKKLHLFDTFTGLPASEGSFKQGDFKTDLLAVQEYLAGYKVAFHRGLFPITTGGLEKEKFSFVHLDGDLYQSILDGIDFFWPRLSVGGYLVIDDYKFDQLPGVEKAVLERFRPEDIEETAPIQCRIKKKD